MMLKTAWRNLWRQRRRSLVTSSALALGIAFCMAIIAFQDGFTHEMRRVMVHQRLGHVQLHHIDFPGRRSLHDALDQASSRVQALQARSDVESLTVRLMGQMLIGGPEKSEGGELIGVEPALEQAFSGVEGMVTEGRYLGVQPDHEVVLGFGLADKIEVGVGDTVVVVTQSADGSTGNDLFTVVGLISTGAERIDNLGGQMHLADMQELLVMEDHAHEISLVTTAGTHEAALAAELRGTDPARDAVVRTWDEVDPQTAKMIETNESMNGVIMVIVLGVASIVILNTMMMVVFERTREIGVLKALGMRPRRIVALILLEAVCLTTISALVGLTIGGLLDWYLVTQGIRLLDGDLTFGGVRFSGHMYGRVNAAEIITTVVFAYTVSLLAALWPAWRASRLDPVVAMRQE
jgi:ABC-type lipoprotein release transport system permease subunit